MSKPHNVFIVYARKDEEFRGELTKHLKPLERRGLIRPWHDRMIGAGDDWKNAIDQRLEESDVVLLLVSIDFLASDYCYEIEMKRALERHESGRARVIPILIRDCHWKDAPFAKLQMLPPNAKAVASWRNWDKAWSDIVDGIRAAVEDFEKAAITATATAITTATATNAATPQATGAPKASDAAVTPELNGAPVTASISFLSKLRPALTEARDAVINSGVLAGFERVTGKHWQNAHDRIGWRVFASPKRDCFLFMGVYHGDLTLQPGIPDLYLFLEMARGGSAQRTMDQKAATIEAAITYLNANALGITWGYVPGGYESIWAVKTTADISEESFESEATSFYRTCALALKGCGILDEFLKLARAPEE
jgi:hypothetical protein